MQDRTFLRVRRLGSCLVLAAVIGVPATGAAHHSRAGVPVKSAKCGWLQGESVRDLRNVADFCAAFAADDTAVRAAVSDRERLWIEATPGFAADVRTGERDAQMRLARWLAEWQRISGYDRASIAIVANHVDVVTVARR